MTNLNLKGDTEAAAEAARQARRLVTSRLHGEHFDSLFIPTLNEVFGDVKDDPEKCAYLIAALTNLAQATVHGLAAEKRTDVDEVIQTIARALEQGGTHL